MRIASFGCVLGLGLFGCTRYQAQPMEARQILEDLRAATLEGVTIPAGPGDRTQAGAFDPSDGLSPSEAVSVALALNPGLRSSRLEKGVADAQLLAAGLYPDPELDARWIQRSEDTTLEANLLQLLPITGERGIRKEKARLRLEEIRWDVAWEEWKLAHAVESAFVEVVAAGQRVEVDRSGLKIREKAAALLEDRRRLGGATLFEVNLAQIDVSNQKRQLAAGETEERLARQALNRLLGLGPDTAYALQEGSILPDDWTCPLAQNALEELAVSRRSDLAAAKQGYEQAERDLQLATRGQYPRLRIGPSYGKDGENDGLGIGAGVDIPLWNRNRGEIAEKLAQREKTAQAFRTQVADVRSEIAAALAEIERERAGVLLYEKETRPRLEQVVGLTEEAIKAGKFDVLSLLLLQDRLSAARRDQVASRAAYRKAAIRLEEVLGVPLTEVGKP